MGAPLTPPVPDAAAPSGTMTSVLPALEKLIKEMQVVLRAPMNVSAEERDGHGAGDDWAEAAWQLTRALGSPCEGARAASGPGEGQKAHEFLQGADEAALRAGAFARDVRARAGVPDLERMAAPGGEAALALGDVRVEEMTAKVFAFDPETDAETTDELMITLLGRDGPTARWSGRSGPLAVTGRTFLDLTAAGEILADAYDRYRRDTHVQDALDFDAEDPR